MAIKRNLTRRERRSIPWYEELVVGTFRNIPYAAAATTGAFIAEQWTATQSLVADVALSIPAATTLVTLDALMGRFTEKNEPREHKMQKGIAAGILGAGVYGVMYVGAALATGDAKETGYALMGALLGYLGVKVVRTIKPERVAVAAIAVPAAICPVFFNETPLEKLAMSFQLDSEKQIKEEVAISNSKEEKEKEVEKKEIVYSSVPPFTRSPLLEEDINVSSCFGYRGRGVARGGTVHHPGVDIDAAFGSAVYAVGNGIVTEVDAKRWGKVKVYHGNDISTEYLHMNTIDVEIGEKVIGGETILGRVGGRGPKGARYYTSHLHLGVSNGNISSKIRRKVDADALMSGSRVNPLCYLDTTILDGIRANTGCSVYGGWDKFCTDYVAFTDSAVELNATKVMLQGIDQKYKNELINAVQGTMIPPSLLVAMSGVESRGKIDAGVGTRYVGILQFSPETAYGYGLCDNRNCMGRDDRLDPAKEMKAAGIYLNELTSKYLEYSPHEDAFAIAAYNAGSQVIDAAILKTEKDGITNGDITWEEVADRITPHLVCSVYRKSHPKMSLNACAKKGDEIRAYVVDVLRYQSLLLDEEILENKVK